MKVSRSQLKTLIKEALVGSGNIAYYYHGSNQPPEVMIPVFLNDNFKTFGGNQGINAVDTLNDAATGTGHYGEWIYKLRINLYGFLITDLSIAKHVYGENFMPSSQILLLTGNQVYFKDQKKWEEEWWLKQPDHDRHSGNIIGNLYIERLFKGVISPGMAVINDYSKVIPVGYKSISDKEFTKVPMEDLRKIKQKIGQSSNPISKRRNEFDREKYYLNKSWIDQQD
jgi:hypothetical protein